MLNRAPTTVVVLGGNRGPPMSNPVPGYVSKTWARTARCCFSLGSTLAWRKNSELGNLKSDLDAGRETTTNPGTPQLENFLT